MNKIKGLLGLHSVQKKVLLMSKIVGLGMMLLYFMTDQLTKDSEVTFFIWLFILVLIVLGVNLLLKLYITTPLNLIKEAAEKIARLNFSKNPDIHTGDEFEDISHSLNQMSENLQNALTSLEDANQELTMDIERERILQTQRKELADSLSHEMKTPLGIIRAYAEGMEGADKETQQKYTEVIISNVNRMDNLIVSLLDLSALEAGAVKLARQPFDFIELVEIATGKLLYDIPNPDFRFEYLLTDEKIWITADKNRMYQVLENLMENAKKHVCHNGLIQINTVINDNTCHFSIYNQGSHIPEHELEKVWDKFYKSSTHSQSGNGLGLAIAAQILTMHGFSYHVENVDDGVIFSIQIPFI